jgi:hypothetical protein
MTISVNELRLSSGIVRHIVCQILCNVSEENTASILRLFIPCIGLMNYSQFIERTKCTQLFTYKCYVGKIYVIFTCEQLCEFSWCSKLILIHTACICTAGIVYPLPPNLDNHLSNSRRHIPENLSVFIAVRNSNIRITELQKCVPTFIHCRHKAYRCILSRNTLHQNLLLLRSRRVDKRLKCKVERLFVQWPVWWVRPVSWKTVALLFRKISQEIRCQFLTVSFSFLICPVVGSSDTLFQLLVRKGLGRNVMGHEYAP